MKRVRETIVERLLHLSASISALATILIFAFMFLLGLPLLSGGRFLNVLTKPWAPHLGLFGIHPMIVGTLVISLLAMAFAFPLSMGCAVLISVTGGRGTSRLVRRTVEAMTGVPTVVYGFVGIFLLVPVVRRIFAVGSGMCVLSASVMLALLVSPTMILFFSDGFDSVPRPYGHAVRALGGTKIQSFLHVVLPCSGRGIAAGFLLALGRALGDTLIALMIAGNAVQVPGSILDSARTLTSHIALVIAADSESPEFRAIFACGVSLYLITTVLVLILRARAPRQGGRTR
jgi:phosphate transport system permease protein